MARTRKAIQPLNLYKYDVLIEDRGTRSEYFKVSQFDGYLYGGRNAFLVAGATVLRPGSKILVEILNKEGSTVYSAPVVDFLEGNSRLIQIEVYNDTPIGPGKLVILGCASTYLDGTPVPNEWKDKFNVRWITDVVISPRIENKTPIRFVDPPDITVEEKFYVLPSSSFFSESVFQSLDVELAPKFLNVYQNGYTIKALGTSSYSSNFLAQGKLTGSVQFVGPNGAETASIDIPITKIYNDELAESEGVLIYTDKQTLLAGLVVSSSGQYTASVASYGEVIVSSSLQLQYNRLVTFDEFGTLVEAEEFNRDAIMSFAKIRLTDLSTISGEIYKTRISYKSATMPSNYEVLADIPLQVSELFVVDSGSRIVETGRFQDVVIDDYWYAQTMSVAQTELNPTLPNYYVTASVATSSALPITLDNTFLLDSINATPEISSGTYVNNVSYFIGNTDLNEIVLFPRSEYTLAFNALATNFSGSNQWAGAAPNVEVYLVPASGSVKVLNTNTKGQLIGQLTPSQNFQRQNFERVEFNFRPEIIESGKVGIRFVVYGGFWNIANVSLKPATEPFFSPDEASVLLPNDFKYDDLLTFKAEFLDVNNNSIGIEATSLPTYFSGSPALTLRDGVVARPGDLEINGLPIYQTLLQDHFTGLITGGLLLTSSDYSQAFTITAGAGFYVDNSDDPLLPVYKYVAWPDLTVTASAFPTSGASADYPRTNVAISLPAGEPTEPVFGLFTGKAVLATAADVIEQADPFTSGDYRNYIVLGRLAHVNSTSIQRTLSLPLTVFARQYHWFDITYSLGPINITGNVYSAASTDLTIEKSAGQTYRIGSNYKTNPSIPDVTTDIATSPTTFAYRYRASGSSTVFIEQPATTFVTGSWYDNGTGTLGTVNNNQWTIQRIFFFGATRTTRIQYGQAFYNSRIDAAAAITTETFQTDPNLAEDAVFRGYLLVRGGAVNLSDLNDAEFIEVSSGFAGSSGGGGATTLDSLSDVDATNPANGDLLIYDSASQQWVHGPKFPYSGSAVITGSLYVTGSVTASSYIIPRAFEPINITGSAAGSTINFNIMSSSVLYHTANSTGNWTLNVRGSATTALNDIISTGQSVTLTLIVTNGATPYSQSAFQIDGSSVTPKWQGTSVPTGNANANDIYSFSIIKTANATFTVFGSKTPFA